MNLARFSVEKPVSITMIILIVMVIGAVAFSRLGIDLLPDIDYPTLTVMVRYPGAPSEEIETIVAKPYEATLASVSGVKKIKSISQEDACFLLMDFVWGTDLDAAASDIREAVAMLEPYLPPDVQDPIVIKFSLTSMPLGIWAVSGMADTVRFRKLLVDTVQDRLERLPGVAQAVFIGGRVEEVQVNVDRASLQGSGVALDNVVMALRAQNLNLPAGRQVQGSKEVLLRTVGMFDNLDAMRDIAVGFSQANGTPVRLGTIADIKKGTRDARSLVNVNGQEALMFMVMKESGANPLEVRDTYIAEMERLKPLLPKEARFDLLMDMSRLIDQMASSVIRDGALGAFLAIMVMFVFVGNIRPTLIIGVAIPLSLMTTFIPMYATGNTLNMMTMGGLILGIGKLVDDAVVVIENIFRHIEEGKDRKTAAIVGTQEVGMAITASTLTQVVVFVPILFAQGLAGQLARGLALTVTVSLLASLFVALTIVPMLASVFLAVKGTGANLYEGRRFKAFKGRYEALLTWCLTNRAKTLGAVAGLIVVTLCTIPLIGAEFMPSSNQPFLMAKVSFPVGTPMDETGAATAQVEAAFRKMSDVLMVGTMLGVDENDPGAGMSDSNPSGVNEAMVFARLKEGKDRDIKSNDELQQTIRKDIPPIADMKFEFMSMDSGMGGTTWPIEVKIYGLEFEAMQGIASRVADEMKGIEGLADVQSTFNVGKPETHITIDRDKAAGYGLSVAQVAMAVQAATQGTVATRYRESGEEMDVRVRYAQPWRSDEADLRQTLIPMPMGGSIPLDQVASIEGGTGPVKIIRNDQKRLITVVANLEGRALSDAMTDVRAKVDPIAAGLPSGYAIDYGGAYESMQDTFGQLLLALLLAILMVYMVMASQFESFSHPFTVLFTMPLAVVGVLWIFLLTRTTLSVPSFVGIIMLAGIVVNNGIVLVDYVNHLRRQGMEIFAATAKGSATRLRPVLITSLTTIMGAIPMAVSSEEGSYMMAPMALTTIGGLAAATVFTLVVVPVVYTYVDAGSKRASAFWMRRLHRVEFEEKLGVEG